MSTNAVFLFLMALSVGLISCQRPPEAPMQAMTLREFKTVYNSYISGWLEEEVQKTESAIHAEDVEAGKEAELKRRLDKLKFRQSLGDYLHTADLSSLPEGLVWEDGAEEKEFSDPEAKRGGVFHSGMMSFPSTFRPFGSNSNGGFRSTLYDDLRIELVDLHPVTGRVIPGLAKKWAVSADQRTVYYELYPDISYSDGSAFSVEDFHRSVFVMTSDYVNTPFAKQYYRDEVAQITLYSDTLIAITLPEPKPLMPYQAAAVSPASEAFYSEYGPDFEQRYQWRVAPHTGAYHVTGEDFVKGVSVTQKRVKHWWADDKPFYRYRFNPDVIIHTVVRDDSKVFELFKIGKMDFYNITIPEYYYEKSEIPAVFDGYVEKTVFYHQFPQIPRGLFLNVSNEKLKSKDLREGLHYAMNWEKVINIVHRGDYARLQQFYQGFGELTNSAVKARRFSIENARASFAKAGYKQEDADGFLVNEAGEILTLTLNYTLHPYYTKMLKILKAEAKLAGVNLLLDGQDGSVSFKTVLGKKHEMAFSGWGVRPPFPNYYQFFHSSNAYDSEGNPKPNTNNINCYADPRMDELSTKARNATDLAELKEVSLEAQQLLHEAAVFIPSYALDFYRVAYWRWLKWPNTDDLQFNAPLVDAPLELHIHWIDEEVKKETIEARRMGKAFPEMVNIYDQYRQ